MSNDFILPWPYVNTITKFNPIKTNLQTHLLAIKERRNTLIHLNVIFRRVSLYLVLLGDVTAMWHGFGRLRQQPPLPLSQSFVGEKKERGVGGRIDPGIWSFLELEFKGTPRSLHKPPSIGTKRKLNLQGAALYTFYRGTFSH